MNYYERHLGDYAKDAGHLSMLEHGAYTLLLDRYYTTEQPIPEDQAHRVCRARSKEERAAVDTVLAEFFTLEDGAWFSRRADAEIERYRAGEPEREAKKSNESNRLKRHRDERSRLFQAVAAAGLHAPWNVSMNELRELAKRCNQPLPETPPATAPATPATATHTPVTNTQEIHTPPTPPTRDGPLPVWMPEQEWADFVAMRKAKGKRAPFTAAAQQGIVRQLDKLRSDGNDPAEVLRQSTMNGWSGVFALKAIGNVRPFASRQAELMAKHFPRIAAKRDDHAAIALG